MKKRGIYLTLLSVVTVAAICFGTYVHEGRLVLNTSNGNFSFSFDSGDSHKTKKTTDAFSSVQINLRDADVIFASGDDYSLTYTGEKTTFPSYKVDSKVLTVTDPASGKKLTGTLTVTVPDSLTEMDALTVSADNGDTEFDVKQNLAVHSVNIDSQNGDIVFDAGQGITIHTMDLSSENGDIDLNSSESLPVDTAALSSGSGDITTDNIRFEKSGISSENGDIDISGAGDLSAYTFHLSGGNGDISIGDDLYSGSLEAGSKITAGEGQKEMALSAGNGDIIVEN